ncbi:RNA polymerase sigma factor [Anaerolinea sp.]|uniref:RNA polymerase sigma factor n=1 Tax=Anaerolinea sp. TaxID=1872519 RepID=UPI002ACD799C|nr:sigma-70 family RNA polymerase sigma factor [Anaerolinea sp.]
MSHLETEWIQQAIQGNEDAFAYLVELYQRPVYNLCYRMLGNAQEAEDAAQEAFWRAYQALRRYDPQRPFITWLLSIAAHYCIDQQRKRRIPLLDLDLLPEEDIPDGAPDPARVIAERDSQEQIHQLLKKLSSLDRAAIILRYWYDFSEEEIARTLSLTVSAVKSRLFRARRELAERYQIEMKKPLVGRRANETTSTV